MHSSKCPSHGDAGGRFARPLRATFLEREPGPAEQKRRSRLAIRRLLTVCKEMRSPASITLIRDPIGELPRQGNLWRALVKRCAGWYRRVSTGRRTSNLSALAAFPRLCSSLFSPSSDAGGRGADPARRAAPGESGVVPPHSLGSLSAQPLTCTLSAQRRMSSEAGGTSLMICEGSGPTPR